MRERLEAWSWKHPKRVRIVYCLGSRYDIDKSRPEVRQRRTLLTSLFGGAPVREKGWLTEAVLEKHIFPPSSSSSNVADVTDAKEGGGRTLTLVAGLPRVYETLCGPRNEREVTGALKKLGWTQRDVVKL